MIQVIHQGAKITGLTTACRVEQSISAAGSQATVSCVCVPGDRYLPKLNPACGDTVEVRFGGHVIFSGQAERADFSTDGMSVTLVCFDPASRLAKNEIYGVFSGMPDEIAAKVLERLGLTPGTLWPGGGPVFIPAGCAMSGLAIIRQAYMGRCVVRCDGDRVDLLEPGARQITLGDQTLLSAAAGISLAEVVNRVEIIGYQGRAEATAERASSVADHGLRQRVLSLSGARATAGMQAASGLRGQRRRASVRLAAGSGQLAACGDSLSLDWGEYGLNGRWLVTQASHDAQAGVMITTLGLEEMES